ncbi:hypothetical protein B0A49_04431 [Cryomyces minteri]|uniref:Uncharacterized protein n=1 Tax=Cryomyces minteri TaxID=331657 RepID=A0A4U0XTE0_9PEZI|nr:hypothetical protein B0A49_04431 [Cryomyces minteri]
MVRSLLQSLLCLSPILVSFVSAQSSTSSGYTGYNLSISDNTDSLIYSTASTPANESTTVPEPDVYLNATVNVGELDLAVSNLTAKINLDAQVLKLLQFNAGVTLSIDRVSLLLQNVSAKVLLEARLENLVLMINDTLNSLDLNPILATLGQNVGTIANGTAGAVSGIAGAASGATSTVARRSYELANNILYSINDYGGNTHTKRILEQSGSIIDQSVDNNGNIHGQQAVGSYLQDMTFNGYNESVIVGGQEVRELEYVYTPYSGLSVISAIYTNAAGAVVGAQVLSESRGGGSSAVGGP